MVLPVPGVIQHPGDHVFVPTGGVFPVGNPGTLGHLCQLKQGAPFQVLAEDLPHQLSFLLDDLVVPVGDSIAEWQVAYLLHDNALPSSKARPHLRWNANFSGKTTMFATTCWKIAESNSNNGGPLSSRVSRRSVYSRAVETSSGCCSGRSFSRVSSSWRAMRLWRSRKRAGSTAPLLCSRVRA